MWGLQQAVQALAAAGSTTDPTTNLHFPSTPLFTTSHPNPPPTPFFLSAAIVPTLWAGTGLLVARNTREAGSRSKQGQHASQMFPSPWNPKFTSPWK